MINVLFDITKIVGMVLLIMIMLVIIISIVETIIDIPSKKRREEELNTKRKELLETIRNEFELECQKIAEEENKKTKKTKKTKED